MIQYIKIQTTFMNIQKETAKHGLKGNIKQLPREMRLSGHAMIRIFSKVHDFTKNVF